MIHPHIKSTSRREQFFPQAINHYGFNRGVEIGVHWGDFSSVLLESNLSLLISIDIWEREKALLKAVKQLKKFGKRNCIIKTASQYAVNLFADDFFDFIYIDSNHDYGNVKNDLSNWWPKLRTGGMFSGHNYENIENYGVIKAVDEFAAIYDIKVLTCEPKEMSWYFLKP